MLAVREDKTNVARDVDVVDDAFDVASVDDDDEDVVARALALARDERLLDARRELSRSRAPLRADARIVADAADAAERWMEALKEHPNGWTRQRSMTSRASDAASSVGVRCSPRSPSARLPRPKVR